MRHPFIVMLSTTLIVLYVTLRVIEVYQYFILNLLFYVELLILLIVLISPVATMGKEKDFGNSYSFDGSGIYVNGHLVYPWAEIKRVVYTRNSDKFEIYPSGSISPRMLSAVPSKGGKLADVTRTFTYGVLEVFTGIGSKPAVSIKTTKSLLRSRRMFASMKEYAHTSWDGIEFTFLPDRSREKAETPQAD